LDLGRLADDHNFAWRMGEDVVGCVSQIDGGSGSTYQCGLLTAATMHGVGVRDTQDDEIDLFGRRGINDGRAGAARLKQDGLAGHFRLPSGRLGLGEAGLTLSRRLRQITIDWIGPLDLDDVDRQDAGLPPVNPGQMQGDIEPAPRLG